MNQWFVIKTKPQREFGVHSLLSKAHFLSFLPRFRQVNHRLSASHLNIKPLFPGYLFINIDFSKPENIHLVKYTRGVSHILCAQNKPLPVADAIVELLQAKMNAQGYAEQPMGIKRGDKIRVKGRGLLQNLEGIFEKQTLDQERIAVLLNLVNYKIKTTLHWSEIEKVKVA